MAPGFEPEAGVLVPERVVSADTSGEAVEGSAGGSGEGKMHTRQRSVMDDLVDHLARLGAASSPAPDSSNRPAF